MFEDGEQFSMVFWIGACRTAMVDFQGDLGRQPGLAVVIITGQGTTTRMLRLRGVLLAISLNHVLLAISVTLF
jgi:hypothetical protein